MVDETTNCLQKCCRLWGREMTTKLQLDKVRISPPFQAPTTTHIGQFFAITTKIYFYRAAFPVVNLILIAPKMHLKRSEESLAFLSRQLTLLA